MAGTEGSPGEARMEYISNLVPVGAKFCNAPLQAAGIGILRGCHLQKESHTDTGD